jgi:hypothetical protein
MSNQTQTARVKPILATNPTIYNLSMPTANNEYSQVLNNSTKRLMIRMRTKGKCRVAFVSGDTAILYFTIEAGAVYSDDNLDLSTTTVYLRSDVGSQIAEILEWT